ncbi:BCCT family transporter [Schinkia azotoformans]|uniref:BCCT family transporter n=1 Tax=Schinkia azotoformans TaxID=1454 RepID=UPI002DB7C379|nr:BCCT family transporter [Schinkia azotoformans]MEC1715124.1 BCCT family transporter [Schinkia azotoformans]MEC1739826.1 BCCT family transporter [Schinkia azotoformans]MEC1745549.1 BCCT family transporter [Schinkia azotoformans]MEC1760069.1 BCCT family transporter [Schinkia azotoformans]MEC1765049.1 BCCT family transporter [Schinkia azotoformans]
MEQQVHKKDSWKTRMNWPVFWISSGFLFAFIIACLINKDVTYKAVGSAYNFVGVYFGGVVQLMMVVFWIMAVVIAFSKWGNIRIGGKNAERETKNLTWYAIIITTMLAAGGVFFAAAEPLSHFLSLPQHFSGIESGTKEAVVYAMAQSYLHWGFLVWGATAFCIPLLVYVKEIKNLPMRPSSMLYLVSGKRSVQGLSGKLLDGLALIGVAAGTIGPVGFLGLQLAFALQDIWGVPNTISTQMIIIIVSTVIFIVAVSTGLMKGMDFLARLTVYLSGVMVVVMLVFGNGVFVADTFVESYGVYIKEFLHMALSRSDVAWLSGWTVFYEAWFLSFGPSMAVLTITLSKGRTLREVLIGIALISPLISNFWFSIFGSTTIGLELQTPGSISNVFSQFGLPSVLITVINQLPLSSIWIPLAIILVVLYLVTTGAGVAYSMAVQATGKEVPYVWVRILYSVLIGVVAMLLVWIGGDSAMNTLQSFMVIAGVPLLIFYIILIPGLIKAAKGLYRSEKHRIDLDGGFVEEIPAEEEITGSMKAGKVVNQ